MSVVRHVQVTASKIEDGAVSSGDVRLSIQTGTGTPPAAAAYVAFSTAFGTPPAMDLEVIGPKQTSSGSWIQDILRVRSGSFQWQGSKAARARWRALGLLAAPSAP